MAQQPGPRNDLGNLGGASQGRETWSIAGHQPVRLLIPADTAPDNVDLFLASHGRTDAEVLTSYVYSRNRSKGDKSEPDHRRYRDWRQALRSIGLLYERRPDADGEDGASPNRTLHITDLGNAVRRWRESRELTAENAPVLGRYAAQALSACQLRNPTDEGSGYGNRMVVFPYAFIWRAMIRLDGKISSEELNRAILRTNNEDDLEEAIERIAQARRSGNVEGLGSEVATDPKRKHDRIGIWMSLASFGWMLINDKRAQATWYTIPRNMRPILEAGASLKRRHLTFSNDADYVEHISSQACLPPDVRGFS